LRTATWVISSLLLLDQAGALDVSIVEHAPGTEGASSARSGPRGRVLTASAFSMLATKALLAWGGTTLWAIGKTPDRNEQKLGLHRTSTRRGKITHAEKPPFIDKPPARTPRHALNRLRAPKAWCRILATPPLCSAVGVRSLSPRSSQSSPRPSAANSLATAAPNGAASTENDCILILQNT
jgi:hypothetical protein